MDAVHELLYNRDGLCLGICNGFQALIKTGLLPNGKIAPLKENSSYADLYAGQAYFSRSAYKSGGQ